MSHPLQVYNQPLNTLLSTKTYLPFSEIMIQGLMPILMILFDQIWAKTNLNNCQYHARLEKPFQWEK